MIILYDQNETEFSTLGIGVLKDAISCTVVEELNGEYELEMEYPITGSYYDHIQISNIILARSNLFDQPQPFRIYKINKPINGVITIYAQHISYDTAGYTVEPFEQEGVQEAFDKMVEMSVIQTPFTFETNKTSDQKIISKSPTSMRSLLAGSDGTFLEVFGGEYIFDRFNIKLVSSRGSNRGFRVQYAKNMTDFKQEITGDKMYTDVYPYYHSTTTETKSSTTYEYLKLYIKPTAKEFSSNWLAPNSDGTGIYLPVNKDHPVQCMTEGDYYEHIFAYKDVKDEAGNVQETRYVDVTEEAQAGVEKYQPDREKIETENIDKDNYVVLPEKIISIAEVTGTKRILPLDLTQSFNDLGVDAYNNPILPTPDQLREKAQKYIQDNKLGLPEENISVSFANVDDNTFGLTSCMLGDTVTVFYKDYNVSSTLEVIKTEYDSISERYLSITLGTKKSNFTDSALTSGDNVSALINDEGYVDEAKVGEIIARTVTADFIQAKEAKISSAQFDSVTVSDILNANVGMFDELIANRMITDDAVVKQTLEAGNIKVAGDITVKNGEITLGEYTDYTRTLRPELMNDTILNSQEYNIISDVWTDLEHIYSTSISRDHTYELVKTTDGLAWIINDDVPNVYGDRIWHFNNNVFYSNNASATKIYDKETKSLTDISISGYEGTRPHEIIWGSDVFTINDTTYYMYDDDLYLIEEYKDETLYIKRVEPSGIFPTSSSGLLTAYGGQIIYHKGRYYYLFYSGLYSVEINYDNNGLIFSFLGDFVNSIKGSDVFLFNDEIYTIIDNYLYELNLEDVYTIRKDSIPANNSNIWPKSVGKLKDNFISEFVKSNLYAYNNNKHFIFDSDYYEYEDYYFSVNRDGYLKATSGKIADFNITSKSIYNNIDDFYDEYTEEGVYIGTEGIRLGKHFSVDKSGTVRAAGLKLELTEEQKQELKGEPGPAGSIPYVEVHSSTYNSSEREPAQVIVNGTVVASSVSRGHLMVLINPVDGSVISQNTYDTFNDSYSLVEPIENVQNGVILCLCTYDSSSLAADAVEELEKFGSLFVESYSPSPTSHVFIGMRGLTSCFEETATGSESNIRTRAYFTASSLITDAEVTFESVTKALGITQDEYTSNGIYTDAEGHMFIKADAIKTGAVAADFIFAGNLQGAYGKIGGFDIGANALYKDKSSLFSNVDGVYLGTDGLAIEGDKGFIYLFSDGHAKFENISLYSKSIGDVIFDYNAIGSPDFPIAYCETCNAIFVFGRNKILRHGEWTSYTIPDHVSKVVGVSMLPKSQGKISHDLSRNPWWYYDPNDPEHVWVLNNGNSSSDDQIYSVIVFAQLNYDIK